MTDRLADLALGTTVDVPDSEYAGRSNPTEQLLGVVSSQKSEYENQ